MRTETFHPKARKFKLGSLEVANCLGMLSSLSISLDTAVPGSGGWDGSTVQTSDL
jgi:hypothetical protein